MNKPDDPSFEVAAVGVRVKRWTVDEYDALADAGVLGPEDRVQLIEGEIVEMVPPGPRHATVTLIVEEVLRSVFRAGYHVRVQLPVRLDRYSEPQPDVAVIPGNIRDYLSHHPTTSVLAVEVADTTLDFDQKRKARVYASAGIPEYWIVNLQDGVLEVYRDPFRDAGGHADYRTAERLAPGDTIAPLAWSDASVSVADLLP